MARPPRDPDEALVTWRFGGRMLGEASLLAAGVLSAYMWVTWSQGPGARATTVAFVAITLIQPLQAMRCRSTRLPWWRLPPNPLIWISLGVLAGVQWLAVATLPFQRLLGTASLDGGDWLVVAVAVLWPVCIMEAAKAFRGTGTPTGRGRPCVAPL